MTEQPDMLDAMVAAIKKGRAELSGPFLGSEENPYILHVPGWMEDRAIEQGTTLQAIADKTFRYHTKVVVVR